MAALRQFRIDYDFRIDTDLLALIFIVPDGRNGVTAF